MGQYYKAALIKETEFRVITPSGWKMMEHAYYGNYAMKRVEHLLLSDSYRVMWIGDYSQCAPFVWTYNPTNDSVDAEDMFHRDDNDVAGLLERDPDKNYYLVNLTRREFINMTKQEMNKDFDDQYGCHVHPLPLLCRCETEEAGGDYHSDVAHEHLGKWAGDKIIIYTSKFDEPLEPWFTRDKKDGYQDMTDVYHFKE